MQPCESRGDDDFYIGIGFDRQLREQWIDRSRVIDFAQGVDHHLPDFDGAIADHAAQLLDDDRRDSISEKLFIEHFVGTHHADRRDGVFQPSERHIGSLDFRHALIVAVEQRFDVVGEPLAFAFDLRVMPGSIAELGGLPIALGLVDGGGPPGVPLLYIAADLLEAGHIGQCVGGGFSDLRIFLSAVGQTDEKSRRVFPDESSDAPDGGFARVGDLGCAAGENNQVVEHVRIVAIIGQGVDGGFGGDAIAPHEREQRRDESRIGPGIAGQGFGHRNLRGTVGIAKYSE